MKKTLITFAFFLLAFSVPEIAAFEYTGIKGEYMTIENTGFYGMGIFTSNKRFDAEAEIFLSSKLLAGTTDTASANYKKYYYAFAGYFHFIRTDSISYYVGAGIMPFIARAYAYHVALGLDFFWHNDFRVFYQYRFLFNTASDYAYPKGSAFSAGFKYTWSSMNY